MPASPETPNDTAAIWPSHGWNSGGPSKTPRHRRPHSGAGRHAVRRQNAGEATMRFVIYCEIQTPPGKSHYDMIWEIMRQIEHADECGFDVYSTIDHHFFQKFSISANPLAMFAAAAQRTSALRFRTALHTLPLETPMRLAGMIAETDILTNG